MSFSWLAFVPIKWLISNDSDGIPYALIDMIECLTMGRLIDANSCPCRFNTVFTERHWQRNCAVSWMIHLIGSFSPSSPPLMYPPFLKPFFHSPISLFNIKFKKNTSPFFYAHYTFCFNHQLLLTLVECSNGHLQNVLIFKIWNSKRYDTII